MYDLLKGIRVLEVSLVTPDQVGQHLADLGAEVLKIEQPPGGDYVRDLGPSRINGWSILHHRWNRSKQSVGVDLRSAAGRELFLEMAKACHVVLDGLRAGNMERFGIGYEHVQRVNPKIVYCSVNSTGQTGPYRELATHGTGPDAYAGLLMTAVRPDGLPYFQFKNQVGMAAGPAYAAIGILAGIIRALTTGRGARLEVAMFDAAAAWVSDAVNAALNKSEVEFEDWESSVRHQIYSTADGKYILFQSSEDKFWVNFCRAVKREDLLEGHERKPVGSHARGDLPLRRALAEIFATRTRTEWVDLFLAHNIAGTPVNSAEDLLDDPHFRARDLIFEQPRSGQPSTRWFSTPIKCEGQEFSATPAPSAGQHTEDVLHRLLGYDAGKIQALRAAGTISR